MTGAFIPQISHAALGTERTSMLKAFEATGKDMKRGGGIDLLPPAEKEACQSFFGKLADYGIFVVPSGEVESWLRNVPLNRGKNAWLSTVFEAMGEDPAAKDYVRPSAGDVWDFIGQVARWVRDPGRKGVPA